MYSAVSPYRARRRQSSSHRGIGETRLGSRLGRTERHCARRGGSQRRNRGGRGCYWHDLVRTAGVLVGTGLDFELNLVPIQIGFYQTGQGQRPKKAIGQPLGPTPRQPCFSVFPSWPRSGGTSTPRRPKLRLGSLQTVPPTVFLVLKQTLYAVAVCRPR